VCAPLGVSPACPLADVAVLSDGAMRLVSLEVCGAESGTAWEGFLQGLIDRGSKAPRLCIIDGNAGLHRAITLAWRATKIQRCAVHKLRNILRKAPQHVHDEITDDYHLIVYASGTLGCDGRARRLREEVEQAPPRRRRQPQQGGRRAPDLLLVPEAAVEDHPYD